MRTSRSMLSAAEVDRMREACSLAAQTLVMVAKRLREGITTDDINTWVHEYTEAHNARPSPLNYGGFPKSVCTSVNEVVCHGIPGQHFLRNGDIVNVDVTTYFPKINGFHGDTSATFYIGEPDENAKHVVEVARRCLELGVSVVRDGARIGDIGAAIQEYAEAQGCSVVRDYVGHGIGREFHMRPQVPHFGTRGAGEKLRAGMVFTVEPMINLGGYQTEVLDDGWTVVTKDGSLSAQFEHTLLVTSQGCEVLTTRPEVLVNSEDKTYAALGPLTTPAAWGGRAGKNGLDSQYASSELGAQCPSH